MRAFFVRNLNIFFRDRTSVFFSLLSAIIIIGLYVLFLEMSGSAASECGVRFLMDSWIMAGLLAVTSMTTTMGAFGIMIDDKTKKISKDFYSSPIRRSSLTSGYILSSYIIGVIMTLFTLVLAEIYILAYDGALLSIALLKMIGMILLSTSTHINYAVCRFVFQKQQRLCNSQYHYRYDGRISNRNLPARRPAAGRRPACSQGLPRLSRRRTDAPGHDGNAAAADVFRRARRRAASSRRWALILCSGIRPSHLRIHRYSCAEQPWSSSFCRCSTCRGRIAVTEKP